MIEKSPPVTASLGFGMQPRPAAAQEPQRKARLLVVDHDPEARRFMLNRLGSAGYAVDLVDGGAVALDACVRARPNVVIMDLRLEDMDGVGLLRELKSRWPELTVIIVTAHATIAEAVRATQCGAFGFLVKPVEKSELLGQVERAVKASTFALAQGDWRADIVTRSHLMEDRLRLANRAAGSDAAVLLTGENGTGKELLARAIHAAGPRRDRPFVTVRCGPGEEPDIEAALAAVASGTLLLDDVGYLNPQRQASLMAGLRKSGARLISTSSVDLRKLMDGGSFRQDLYYHLNIMPIEIPPLGRRREDIPLLVSHFLEQATVPGENKKLYTPEAIELLATTDWPGNVRQLFELVKQNVALSHGKIMSKEFVERSLGRTESKVPGYDEARESFARSYLTQHLQSTAGNVSQAARIAKRNRTDFYKLLAKYRVQPDDFKK